MRRTTTRSHGSWTPASAREAPGPSAAGVTGPRLARSGSAADLASRAAARRALLRPMILPVLSLVAWTFAVFALGSVVLAVLLVRTIAGVV